MRLNRGGGGEHLFRIVIRDDILEMWNLGEEREKGVESHRFVAQNINLKDLKGHPPRGGDGKAVPVVRGLECDFLRPPNHSQPRYAISRFF